MVSDKSGINFKGIIDNFYQPLALINEDLQVVYVNEAAKILLDIKSQEIKSSVLLQDILILDEKDQAKLGKAMQGRQKYSILAYKPVKDAEKDLIEIKLNLYPFPSNRGAADFFLLELQEGESLSLAAGQLQSLGKKAGQIAHSMSNQLAVLRINCDSLTMQAQKAESLSQNEVLNKVSKISTATEGVTAQNQDLKNLAKSLVNLDADEISALCQDKNSDDQFH